MSATILQLDESGIPFRWISTKQAIKYYSKDKILYELGNPIATIYGGNNRFSCIDSKLVANSIIAVKGAKFRRSIVKTPQLNNKSLFERDKYTCAYCGKSFTKNYLSRDHIIPVSRGGLDIWNNVVTACKKCNNHKGAKLLSEVKFNLLYDPYTPDFYEHFILTVGKNKILDEQLDYLISRVSQKSRLKLKNY